MNFFEEQHRSALMSCIEIVIMRRNGPNYHLVQTKLDSRYGCKILDCYDHPGYLRTILKEVYSEDDYNSIIDEVKLELSDLIEVKEIANFLKVMQS